MKLGNFKNFIFFLVFLFVNNLSVFAADKIESVPLINLEELSPTFEEDKDELEKIEKKNVNLNNIEDILEKSNTKKDNKIYINLKALDKITAKTSAIRLAVGEKEFFGSNAFEKILTWTPILFYIGPYMDIVHWKKFDIRAYIPHVVLLVIFFIIYMTIKKNFLRKKIF